MIDFLKLVTYCQWLIDYFKNNSLLEWVSDEERINHFNKEVIKTKTIKQYKGILFCFYENRLDILFKPHYFFNSNFHNANDFKAIYSIKVIKEFKNTFKTDLSSLKIVNIEFGLNVVSPINIKHLITLIAYHEKNEFKSDKEYPFSKKSYRVKNNGTANYYKIIKAYAKGLQYPKYADINTFRFEIKSKESKYINELGIKTLDDLLNYTVYEKMSTNLINEFKKVLILDNYTDLKILTPKEQAKLNTYLNPLTWYKLINQNRNSFSKNKVIYYKLIDKTGEHLKKTLEAIIIEKLDSLKKGAISTTIQKTKKDADSTVYIDGICNLNNNIKSIEVKKNICKVTGLDISMQKENSNLLSHTGLKFYYNTDRQIFEQIKQKYLSKHWHNSDFQTQIREIAHSIRHASNYSAIKQKRIYNPSQFNFLPSFGI